MIGIAIANSLGLNKISGINPAAQAFITATGITGTTEVNAVNNLVNGLQADGLWSKMKAVYPFVTDNRNFMSYTEDFSNAYWGKSGATVTVNNITAPDGTMTADRVVYSTTNNYVYGVSTLLGGIGTQSFYVKGTLGETLYADDGYTSTSLITLTGDWQRVTFTTTRFSNQLHGILIGTYSGATARTIYLWGAQVDSGSTATTYQPIATTQQAYIAAQFKYNLVNPVDSDASFRLVFNGGWTHSSNGATPNGTNGYADTKLVPSSVFGSNYAAQGSYYRETFTAGGTNIDGTCTSSAVSRFDMGYDFGVLVPFVAIGTNTSDIGSDTDNKGLVLSTRQSASSVKMYRNNSVTVNSALSFTAYPAFNYFIAARNQAGTATLFSNSKSIAFKFISDSLTNTDVANLTTKVQAFQTALNRQIP